MKKQPKPFQKLKKDADKVTSELVRRTGADPTGWNSCYTCGVRKHWKELQCGHFVSRTYGITRWYLPNLRVQCYSCNVMNRGNLQEFGARLEMEKPGEVIRLTRLKHTPNQCPNYLDVVEIIRDYKERLKKLDENSQSN